MNHISTDEAASESERYRAGEGYRIPSVRPDHDFRQAYGIVVGALAALCLIFLGLTWFQGPKLQDAVIDTTRATEAPNQQLRLFVNQAVAQISPEQVTITPAAEFSITVASDIIGIQFEDRLQNDTEYTVEIADVTSAYHDQGAAIRHSFTTAPAEVLYLDRADPEAGGTDSITRVNVSTGELETVFSANSIQRFAVTGQVLVVQTVTEDTTNGLSLVNLFDGVVEEVGLPVPGRIDALQASEGFVAFTFTEADPTEDSTYLATLVRIDLAAVHDVEPVVGLDGGSLEVVDWLFIPGSTQVLALSAEDSLLRLDLAGVLPAIPLGSYGKLESISADGTKAIVGNVFDTIELSLEDGSESLVLPRSVGGVAPFPGVAWPLAEGDARVQNLVTYDFETNESQSFIMIDDGHQSRQLYATAGIEGVEDFSVSPNEQYVAVEVFPSGGEHPSDGYYPDARSTAVVTRIFAADSGALVRELTGFAVNWHPGR